MLVTADLRVVAHAGITYRVIRVDNVRVPVARIGGVMTLPDWRRHGLANPRAGLANATAFAGLQLWAPFALLTGTDGWSSSSSGVATWRNAESKRILVIDDESGVRRLLTDLLAGEGHDVSEAADGIQGLERLRDVSPDLIFLDLMMPVVSGWAFAEECRQVDIYGDVPIIAMSAMFDLHSAAATLDALSARA